MKTRDGNAIQNPFLPIVNRQALIMLKGKLSLLKKPSGHEIGVPMKVTLDDIR